MPEKKRIRYSPKDKTDTRSIHQSLIFDASPTELYELLMDSRKHSHFTGSPASISNRVSGRFTAYDGWIEGKNLELVPGKKIVQYWRGSDWPRGHYSTVQFEFFPMKNRTRLIFTQKEVPSTFHSAIAKGWTEHYWEKMKKVLAEESQ